MYTEVKQIALAATNAIGSVNRPAGSTAEPTFTVPNGVYNFTWGAVGIQTLTFAFDCSSVSLVFEGNKAASMDILIEDCKVTTALSCVVQAHVWSYEALVRANNFQSGGHYEILPRVGRSSSYVDYIPKSVGYSAGFGIGLGE